MIPHVDLSRVTSVVVAPFGQSGFNFATDLAIRLPRGPLGGGSGWCQPGGIYIHDGTPPIALREGGASARSAASEIAENPTTTALNEDRKVNL